MIFSTPLFAQTTRAPVVDKAHVHGAAAVTYEVDCEKRTYAYLAFKNNLDQNNESKRRNNEALKSRVLDEIRQAKSCPGSFAHLIVDFKKFYPKLSRAEKNDYLKEFGPLVARFGDGGHQKTWIDFIKKEKPFGYIGLLKSFLENTDSVNMQNELFRYFISHLKSESNTTLHRDMIGYRTEHRLNEGWLTKAVKKHTKPFNPDNPLNQVNTNYRRFLLKNPGFFMADDVKAAMKHFAEEMIN